MGIKCVENWNIGKKCVKHKDKTLNKCKNLLKVTLDYYLTFDCFVIYILDLFDLLFTFLRNTVICSVS